MEQAKGLRYIAGPFLQLQRGEDKGKIIDSSGTKMKRCKEETYA